jgi:hypothetical protein
MRTRRRKAFKKSIIKNKKTFKKYGKNSGKKWVTAIEAAEKTLNKTGNIESARKSLRKQALTNARRLFGSISSTT